MVKLDCYETLGISRSADEKEIKRAYRKLAKKYHPDTNQGNKQAELKFKEVTEAYDILSNPEKKKLYDRYGMAAFDGSMGNAQGGGSPFEEGMGNAWSGDGPFSWGGSGTGFGKEGPYTEYHYSSQDGSMEDILRKFFGGAFEGQGAGKNFSGRFQRGFGNDFHGSRQGFHYNSHSGRQDLHAEIQITLEEAAFGCDKLLHMEGARQERLQVHIPAGINEGQSVRLRGKGQPGWNGGPAGDLLIKVHIMDNPVYTRKGMDVYTTASVPYETASRGGEAYVQTLYGTVKCKIPAGIRSGGKIRLRNKGIVSMKNADIYGDEYVTIKVQG